MKSKKLVIVLSTFLYAVNLYAQKGTYGNLSAHGTNPAKADNASREVMGYYFMPDKKHYPGLGFTMGVHGRIFNWRTGFIFQRIEMKLGMNFGVTFMETTGTYKDDWFRDTSQHNPVESFYTTYLPSASADLGLFILKRLALIPQGGYYYGFGTKLYENATGATVDGPDSRIKPNPRGFFFGACLKIGPVGLFARRYLDEKAFFTGNVAGIGLKF